MAEEHPYFRRKTPVELLGEIYESSKGKLKIYIGAAPGVGKTFKMLQDAHEARLEGKDIVIGYIESHGRKETEAQVQDLECVPLAEITYKNRHFTEVNVPAILKRNPEIVLIDELAHTNIPGSKWRKRFQDVEELLEAGITVWCAVNIQHIASVNDIVKQITGVAVRERVPDFFIQKADELQVIDASPETLQKRLLEGKIYKSDKIEQSLQNFFTINNLSALRELLLREAANEVDEKIESNDNDIDGPIGVYDRILVCVQYGPTAERLIRRGARVAKRLKAELYILNISSESEGSYSEEKKQKIKLWKELAAECNAHFIIEEKGKKKPANIIVEVAKKKRITQIVMGQSARTRWEEITKGSIVNIIMRHLRNTDIMIVSDGRA
ncbi:KdpD-like non-kinase potassium sensor [Bacillus massiliigorillae]|uniref:KdpD-like non-kinase potassium sensor n=1 Tax=Bacillus massiliigorillae TaxID=1243664 RepID=UPI00039D7709|nr:KdpD-like non-kinase potassium sensor [Bacillus massiliigorillae]